MADGPHQPRPSGPPDASDRPRISHQLCISDEGDPRRSGLHLGQTALGPALADRFANDAPSGKVECPSFREASFFILNQYEFLASATRSGAVDLVLMKESMGGPIRNLVTTYSVQIETLRRSNPKAFRDLVWLHRTISGSLQPYLGPPA